LYIMSSLTVTAVEKLLALRSELEETLKCNFCGEILQNARTLNCPHHMCAHCAVQQQTDSGMCSHCMCSFYKKDIANNIVVNNIVDTFHDLAANIERAAQLMDVQTDGKYHAEPSEEESTEEEPDDVDGGDDSNGSNGESAELRETENSRKRKRTASFEAVSESDHGPSPKKRRLSHDPDSGGGAETDGDGDGDGDGGHPQDSEEEKYWVPTRICVSGYDKAATAKLKGYAAALDISLTTNWSYGATDITITKTHIQDGSPLIGFKVLASILRNIPVVRASFLEDSYERRRVLDYTKYLCNYRRVGNHRLFEGLGILFATTKMPTKRLRTLVMLGGASVLGSEEELHDKDPAKLDRRLMICMHETEEVQARQLSKEYNCRVVSENYILKCIHPEDFNEGNLCLTKRPKQPPVDRYQMEPITERLDVDAFDLALGAASEDEEDSDDGEGMNTEEAASDTDSNMDSL